MVRARHPAQFRRQLLPIGFSQSQRGELGLLPPTFLCRRLLVRGHGNQEMPIRKVVRNLLGVFRAIDENNEFGRGPRWHTLGVDDEKRQQSQQWQAISGST